MRISTATQTRSRSHTCAAVIVACLAACGDDAAPDGAGGTGGAAGAAGSAGAAPSGGGELYGTFNVTLNPAMAETMSRASTTIVGTVYDGPALSPSRSMEMAEADGCRLYVPSPVFCAQSCGAGAICVDDDTCATHPKSVDVGTVTITGVGQSPIMMDRVVDSYQPKAGVVLPHPPCAEGSAVMLRASDIELSTACIAPLAFDGTVRLEKGQPIRLTWGAPGRPELSKIRIKVDISYHAGSKGRIECEVADNGSFEIAASLSDGLLELGVAGFPVAALTRVSSAAGSGKTAGLSLNVVATVDRPIEIPGLVSCSEDTECPSGQTCQVDRRCG